MKKSLILGLALIFVLVGCGSGDGEEDVVRSILSVDEAKGKAEEFITRNLIGEESHLEITEIKEEGDVYKMVVQVDGQDIDSYMTKDGKKFFPQALNMDLMPEDYLENEDQSSQAPSRVTVSQKKATPEVELFVMALCPYSAQIEKGLLPVLELLDGKIDFELKFCDYVMRGKEEIEEQLIQYCLQKEGKEELLAYLNCFVETSNSSGCLEAIGVDLDEIQSCTDDVDQKYGISVSYEDQSSWRSQLPNFDIHLEENEEYGVSGSPTLVINGETVGAPRDPNGLLKTICSAFEEEPQECRLELSSSTPSPGFGSGTADPGSATGGCG